ncbi:MAG: DUF4199 family protein [Bacteroidia bacterium]|nr:DUF4199 family protein [Bacteroidia bacterium]NND53069.1 DUF4199 family protein [Flavobacteriaceae bacterium]
MRKIALPIRFGIAISGSLIAFFLLLALFGQHTSPIYSLFNGVITGFGIYEAIKSFKLSQGDNFNYTEGFRTGLIAGGIATLIFTVFFIIYTTEIEAGFLAALTENMHMDISIGLVVFTVAIMGLATTVILTLTFMQLFKPSRNLS